MKIEEKTVTLKEVEALIARGDRAIAAGDGTFDFAALARADSSAVACLLHWKRGCEKAGIAFEAKNLPEGLRDLCSLYEVDGLLAGG